MNSIDLSSVTETKSAVQRFFDAVIASSLKHRRSTLFICSLVAIIGLIVIPRLPIDVLPDLNRPFVTVLIEASGLAPEEVETLVTVPVESSMLGGPGITNVRSQSNSGLAQVHVEFEWGTDAYVNRQIVKERIDNVINSLPRNAEVRLGPISSIMGEIQLVGLTAKEKGISLVDLRTYADWTLRKRLLAIRGVSSVSVIGGEAREYQIQVDRNKFSAYDTGAFTDSRYLSFNSMKESLNGMGENTGGGFIEKDGKEFSIRNLGNITGVSDIENAVVGYRGSGPVRVKDIARVVEGYRTKRGDAGVNGQVGVILIIQKQPGVSTLDLTKQISTELEQQQKSNPQINIHANLFRQADFIQRSIDNVVEAIRDGSIIIVFVVFIFLWSLRTTVITLLTLPLSLISAVLLLASLGFELNTMTIGGLAVAVGQLVDDAIVDMENIFRRLKENRSISNPRPALQIVFEASSEVRNSIVLATAVVVLVFIPLFFLGDLEGRLFRPLALAYIIALLTSLAVALTMTPVLCYFLLPNRRSRDGDSALVRFLKNLQAGNLRWLLDRPRFAISAIVFLSVISFGLAFFLKQDFLPPFNEGVLTVFGTMDTATSLPVSVKKMQEVEQVLLTTRGVGEFARRTGRAEGDEHASGPHSTEIEVNINPEKADKTRGQILSELRSRFKTIGDIDIDIGQPISHRIDHMMTGVRSEVAVFVYGEDLESIQYQAYEIRNAIKTIEGVTDLLVENQKKVPELKIAINHEQASRFGVNPAEVTRILESTLGGLAIGRVIDHGNVFGIVLRFDEKSRRLDGLENVVIKYLPNGSPVRLGNVADVYETEGPYEIKRENGNRRIAVQFNVAGRDPGQVVSDVKVKLASLKLQNGVRYEIGGRFASRAKSFRLIAIFALCSLLLITVLIYSHFKSWALTSQILINIPFSFMGGILALFLAGSPLSIASMVGFVALTGVASRNGIMMISHFIHLMEVEGEDFSRDLVIRGALERLVPVLMTAFSAAFALLPILLTGSDAPGKEILFPMALVICGGLFSATLLDIAFTPVIFYHVMQRQRRITSSITNLKKEVRV